MLAKRLLHSQAGKMTTKSSEKSSSANDKDIFFAHNLTPPWSHKSPFSLYRLMLDHPPLNTVWKGKLMLLYWERTKVSIKSAHSRASQTTWGPNQSQFCSDMLDLTHPNLETPYLTTHWQHLEKYGSFDPYIFWSFESSMRIETLDWTLYTRNIVPSHTSSRSARA